jgi:hypothetical protein
MATTLLDRLVEPVAACLTPAAARKLVELRADPDLQARVDELADKANLGSLTDEERGEYDRYLAAFHLVTILQAQARKHLRSPAA